jgi:hypothetical protein
MWHTCTLRRVFARIDNIASAYIYESWAAQLQGEPGDRPVADIDVLVLGSPDREEINAPVNLWKLNWSCHRDTRMRSVYVQTNLITRGKSCLHLRD